MVTLVHHCHFVRKHARRRLDLLRPCCCRFYWDRNKLNGRREKLRDDINQDRLCCSSIIVHEEGAGMKAKRLRIIWDNSASSSAGVQ
jgi:hypothetical protein